jgi:hypothetical protein
LFTALFCLKEKVSSNLQSHLTTSSKTGIQETSRFQESNFTINVTKEGYLRFASD